MRSYMNLYPFLPETSSLTPCVEPSNSLTIEIEPWNVKSTDCIIPPPLLVHLEEKNSLETSHGLAHTYTHTYTCTCISRGNDRRVEDIDDATMRCQGISTEDAITVKSKISPVRRKNSNKRCTKGRKWFGCAAARNVTFILDNIEGTIDRKRSSGCW